MFGMYDTVCAMKLIVLINNAVYSQLQWCGCGVYIIPLLIEASYSFYDVTTLNY